MEQLSKRQVYAPNTIVRRLAAAAQIFKKSLKQLEIDHSFTK
jgi:hypothetical protein